MFIRKNQTGFILTMWYVNAYVKTSNEVFIYCFILTMWYVNELDLDLSHFNNRVLY